MGWVQNLYYIMCVNKEKKTEQEKLEEKKQKIIERKQRRKLRKERIVEAALKKSIIDRIPRVRIWSREELLVRLLFSTTPLVVLYFIWYFYLKMSLGFQIFFVISCFSVFFIVTFFRRRYFSRNKKNKK